MNSACRESNARFWLASQSIVSNEHGLLAGFKLLKQVQSFFGLLKFSKALKVLI